MARPMNPAYDPEYQPAASGTDKEGIWNFVKERWLFILVGVFFLLTFFWSKYFLFVFFKLGLKKERYKGKAKLMKTEEIIRRLIYNEPR